MRLIIEFDDYLEDDLELGEPEKAMIRNWIQKYEKYFNFHNSGEFVDSIEQVTKDCVEQLGLDKSKTDAVQDYLESLYTLADGLSVVMSPGPEFQYTNIDQVQRFQY
jgi:hypothetical protein